MSESPEPTVEREDAQHSYTFLIFGAVFSKRKGGIGINKLI